MTAVINNNYLDSFHSAELPDSFLEDHDHFKGELGTQDNDEGDLVIEEVDEEQLKDDEETQKKVVSKKRSKSHEVTRR